MPQSDVTKMGRPVVKDRQAFKREYKRTNHLGQSMLAAGYSQTTALKGISRLPQDLRQYVVRKQRKLNKLVALASTVSAEEQELIARGALLSNIEEGKDRAVNSIKLAGQDKRVGMFGGESSGAVVLIQPPVGVMERLIKSLGPVVEGEVVTP